MWPGERALRGRGAVDEVLLARPERPRRWTLPITALRVTPPSSAAIWLAESPSAHSFFKSSTRSSVQVMPQLLRDNRSGTDARTDSHCARATIGWPDAHSRYQ